MGFWVTIIWIPSILGSDLKMRWKLHFWDLEAMASHFFLLDHTAVYDIKLWYRVGPFTRAWDRRQCVRDFALKWIVPIAGGREKVTIAILDFKKCSLLLSSVCHAWKLWYYKLVFLGKIICQVWVRHRYYTNEAPLCISIYDFTGVVEILTFEKLTGTEEPQNESC